MILWNDYMEIIFKRAVLFIFQARSAILQHN